LIGFEAAEALPRATWYLLRTYCCCSQVHLRGSSSGGSMRWVAQQRKAAARGRVRRRRGRRGRRGWCAVV